MWPTIIRGMKVVCFFWGLFIPTFYSNTLLANEKTPSMKDASQHMSSDSQGKKKVPFAPNTLSEPHTSSDDTAPTAPNEEDVDFSSSALQEITFSGVPPTKYSVNSKGELLFQVSKSSSTLIYPFKEPKKLKGIKFEAYTSRRNPSYSAKIEREKKGDDAGLRVGLIFEGEERFIPFFAPSWVKEVRKVLHFPPGKMIYFLLGTKQQNGEDWPSPYTDSIWNYVPLSGVKAEPLGAASSKPRYTVNAGSSSEPYRTYDVVLSEDQQKRPVIGLWLMADGDNSEDSFQSGLRRLRFIK